MLQRPISVPIKCSLLVFLLAFLPNIAIASASPYVTGDICIGPFSIGNPCLFGTTNISVGSATTQQLSYSNSLSGAEAPRSMESRPIQNLARTQTELWMTR